MKIYKLTLYKFIKKCFLSTALIDEPAQLNSSMPLKTGHTIKNRLFKSAMSEQLGTTEHNPIAGLTALYKRWAEGGIGLSMTANIMVDRLRKRL